MYGRDRGQGFNTSDGDDSFNCRSLDHSFPINGNTRSVKNLNQVKSNKHTLLKRVIINNENRRQNVISFYQLEVCQQKWLQKRFNRMLAVIRDVLWIEVAAILERRTGFNHSALY